MAAHVAALQRIIIDLQIFTLIHDYTIIFGVQLSK